MYKKDLRGFEASIWPLILPEVCCFHHEIHISPSASRRASKTERRAEEENGGGQGEDQGYWLVNH